MTRSQARADVMRMLAGTGVGASLFAIAPNANREAPVSRSVHSMQQQPRREDMVEYYARRAREAQAQADARKGEVYDDDLDTWRQGDPGDENDNRITEALCGPMGRTVA